VTAPDPAGVTDGLLVVDKPAGMTSHDVVGRIRRLARTRRVGHAGTLDPMATGVLVIGVGQATRLLGHLSAHEKEYAATIRLGTSTGTDDAEGDVIATAPEAAVDAVTDAALAAAMAALTGEIEQVPPAYSAKKVAGKVAYDAAREGAPLPLEPARVVVHGWDVRALRHDALDATITCGGGTYIRALARDLGRLTGSAAHLSALRRTRSGDFDVADAVPLDALRSAPPALRRLRIVVE
jgi:tRNA pseudouridine55 synthase